MLKRIDAPFPTGWDAGLSVEHKTAIQAQDYLGSSVFRDFFSFAFVRNPWDWQVSIYHHVLRDSRHKQHDLLNKLGSFDRYVRWLCEDQITTRDNRCQSAFLHDKNGQQLVNFVGRFESLQADFEKICCQIGVSTKLPKLNSAHISHDYRRFYSDQTMELISWKYAEDIERFAYRFDARDRQHAVA